MASEQPESGPDGPAVARRALLWAGLAQRAELERMASQGDGEAEHLEQACQELAQWAEECGLTGEWPQERMGLGAGLGTWDAERRAMAEEAGQGLPVLAWALGAGPAPNHESPADALELAQGLGLFKPPKRTVLSRARLRPRDQTREAARTLSAIAWRLERFAMNQGAMDFQSLCREGHDGAGPVHGVPCVGGDLAIGGLPLALVDDEVRRLAVFLTQARLAAAQWVAGTGE